jgi:hypothetical protein
VVEEGECMSKMCKDGGLTHVYRRSELKDEAEGASCYWLESKSTITMTVLQGLGA